MANPPTLICVARTAARGSLALIEHDYQVADDRMVSWSPSIMGAIPIPHAPARTITVTEGRLLDQLTFGRGLLGFLRFADIKDEAFAEADRRFPPLMACTPAVVAAVAALPAGQRNEAMLGWPRNDGHNDAFRHTYWNARLTIEFGERWTRAFTTAHEGSASNPAVREAMDLYNNAVGRSIGVDNPGATPRAISDLVHEAVVRGDTVVVGSGGHLEWSDRVRINEHGVAALAPAPAVIPTPGIVSVP